MHLDCQSCTTISHRNPMAYVEYSPTEPEIPTRRVCRIFHLVCCLADSSPCSACLSAKCAEGGRDPIELAGFGMSSPMTKADRTVPTTCRSPRYDAETRYLTTMPERVTLTYNRGVASNISRGSYTGRQTLRAWRQASGLRLCPQSEEGPREDAHTHPGRKVHEGLLLPLLPDHPLLLPLGFVLWV